VYWYHYTCQGSYAKLKTPTGRATTTLAFSVLLSPDAYPIVFHCIGGTDRTGTFAYLLNALLGVDEEELVRDYEISFIGGGGVTQQRYEWLEKLIATVRELPGDTLADKVKRYFISLGFTDEQIENLREFLLEKKQ